MGFLIYFSIAAIVFVAYYCTVIYLKDGFPADDNFELVFGLLFLGIASLGWPLTVPIACVIAMAIYLGNFLLAWKERSSET